MWPILFTSVVALAAVINRGLYWWRTRGDAAALTREVLRSVDAGLLDRARERCTASAQPVAALLAEALSAWDQSEEELNRRMEQSAMTAVEQAEAQLPVLATTLAVMPMLGFLGTILGLIDSFTVWEKAGAGVGIEQLSSGIAAAMITTGAGLVASVPYTILYNLFTSRAAKVARSLNFAGSEVLGRHRARPAPALSVVRPASEAR